MKGRVIKVHSMDAPVKRPPIQYFLKGPIYLDWLSPAARMSGKTFQVAIALRIQAGMAGSGPFKLSYRWARALGIGRQAVYNGLRALEKGGLISVERAPGCSPTITINKAPEEVKKHALP